MLNKSLYLFIAQLSGYATRMMLPIFLVRTLTKAEYGSYSQFFLVEALIDTFFQMGSNQALYYFVPRDEKNAGAYFLNSLLLNIVLFTIGNSLIGVFRHTAADIMGMPVIVDLYWQLFGYTMILMMGTSAECYLISRNYVKQGAIFIFLRHFIVSIITLWAAYKFRRVDMIISALVAARTLSVIGVLIYIHFKMNGFRAEKYFTKFWDQFKYGAMLGMGGIMWAFLMRLHQVAVTKTYDIETFAVYSVGLRQIPVLQYYSQSVSSVVMSEVARFEKSGEWDKIRDLWNRVLERMYGIGIPITVFFLLLSKPLVVTLFTSEYAEAVPIFRINTIGMLYLVLNPTIILRAMNRNDITLKVQGGFLVLAPLLLYGGYRLGGMVGIIAAHAVLLLGVRVACHAVLNRIVKTRLPYFVSLPRMIAFYKHSFRKAWQMGVSRIAIIRGRA